METLTKTVAIIVLVLMSSPLVALLLSLPKNSVTRILSYVVGTIGVVGGMWLISINPTTGTFTMSAWVIVGNAGALYTNFTRSRE
ncbi:MAG: hypothetical protein RL410_681 [Actinomycetota bacterium]|jgi:hypothetical protein